MSDRITLSFPNRFLGGKTKHPVSNIQDTTGSTKSHLLNRAVNFLTSTNLFSSLTDIFSSCLSHVQASLSLPISLSSLSSFSKILLTFLYLNGRERERDLQSLVYFPSAYIRQEPRTQVTLKGGRALAITHSLPEFTLAGTQNWKWS